MSSKQLEGYELAEGVVCYFLKFSVVLILIWAVLIGLGMALGIGMNDSDASRWNRSGLKVLVDAKTGIEYLSDGHGGMVTRYPVTLFPPLLPPLQPE